MKKFIMSLIGMMLFVAGYQHTRRQAEYMAAQPALTNGPAYAAPPASMSVSLKTSVAFRLIKPS